MTPRAALLVPALALVAPSSALEVSFGADHASYVVTEGAATLFTSTSGIAVFCDDKWWTQHAKTLVAQGAPKHVTGTHPALGAFEGVALSWLAGKTPVVTTAKNFASKKTVAFETSFPRGAAGTSFVQAQNKTDSNAEVIVQFPAFTNWTLPGVVSWAGSFVGAQQGKLSTGPTGGPTVFFDPADAELKTVVVGSAVDNFKDTSAGPGHTWDGTTPAWAPGISGTITSLPAEFTQTTILTIGTGPGITAAIGEWGELLQAYHKAHKVPDVTLEKIGYQTDNGAYYVFCSGNCSKKLLDTVATLKESKVPMGYLSFQGAGASHLNRHAHHNQQLAVGASVSDGMGAPWCIGTWGPDAGTSHQFPVPEPEFQKALGIPLQLYAPYFCDQSEYFTRVNASASPPWQSYQSDITLPGCGGFGFQDVIANQSLDFYRWFYKKGVETGMVSFEPDFMNQNYK